MVKVTTMMMAASVVVTASVRAVKGRRLVPTRAALVLVRLSAAKPTWVVVMTQSAVQKVRELLKENPEALGLKVGVRQRGCNGLSYVLDYATEKGKFDEEVVQDGVRVIIDKKAQLTLLGTEMDYVQSKLSAEFVFNNPNIKGTCGCGESFSI
ncbi:iron-sulfur cluster assembly 1 homolog, mitochondrial isoform X1 [Cherax quadricarinatus]|uniref:iron-sulfur cluster assembly 1 homolog, mitochondrial isoform X1 n=1 Tax=Cherax quadricarinatus TaxID=27406 RepID=UPI002377E24F|nr:iron-sulfur cluster assembly 1 homolog, mitochondrial-like isoform X1 [Cherax quadricarinatus]